MRRYFEFVTKHPYPVLAVVALIAGVLGLYMFGLTRETHPDTFIPADHPALLAKLEVDHRFDLNEPLVVGIIRDAKHGIFTESTISLIRDLTVAIQKLPQIDSSDVMSLATESGVYFDEDGEPGFDLLLGDTPETRAGLDSLKNDILSYELYRGTLVAADGSAGAIIIAVDDDAQAEALYHRLSLLLDGFPTTDEQLIVTGEPAVRAYMGTAVSDDALRMNFVCPIVMALLIILAYRTLRGTVLPLCVIGGASAMALGLMSVFGVPVFIVTNGIFVIIMALGVADSLHLVGQYYEEQLAMRGRDTRTIVVDACMALWYPVLITSLTDIAGFLALYITGVMPPIRFFGLFTCFGVAGALIYSFTVIPAGLAILPLKSSGAFTSRASHAEGVAALDRLGRFMSVLGTLIHRRRKVVLVVGVALIGGAFLGSLKLVVNDSRLLAFKDDHPMVQATNAFNERFDGTNQLNIVLSSAEPRYMLEAQTLKKIARLEEFTEQLPFVGGTHSLVGWVKRAHQKMNRDDPDFFAIPDDPGVTGFYLDVLRAPSSPMSRLLSEVVDADYGSANLIVRMTSSEYVHQRETITALQGFIDSTFSDGALTIRLAGRANLDYHWLGLVRQTHIRSVLFSILCVLLLTGLMFRSMVAGLLCTFTVAVAVLVNYAVMGIGGIGLGVGTSMFASIAIGAGVNFPIHLLDRLRLEAGAHTDDDAGAIQRALAFTGRALFFTAFVVALGFLLLAVSEFSTLVRFGLLIAIAMLVSFVVSVTVLPAIVAVCRPRFVFQQKK
ncbi:MAG: MMPL family transporter [candidate division Zixibacteria bacterium]|nr:MMPL family transporter [candidate division Zixibacteria bacterium]MDH3936407.1 MMPL family transporter [candidate division Zixibacteria bacterium]MDH4034223.1 MMPL family transporter [candidate division Zixibacteria bacterium]